MGYRMVKAAMDYQEARGEGDGYFLKLTLRCGRILTGACRYPDPTLGHVRLDVPDANGDRKPAWISFGAIAYIGVQERSNGWKQGN
jgi:hypothetical protein